MFHIVSFSNLTFLGKRKNMSWYKLHWHI